MKKSVDKSGELNYVKLVIKYAPSTLSLKEIPKFPNRDEIETIVFILVYIDTFFRDQFVKTANHISNENLPCI